MDALFRNEMDKMRALLLPYHEHSFSEEGLLRRYKKSNSDIVQSQLHYYGFLKEVLKCPWRLKVHCFSVIQKRVFYDGAH